MANHQATGKKAKFGEVAKSYSFRLYSWEVEKVKNLIKSMRVKAKKSLKAILIFCLFYNMLLPTEAASIRMNAPSRDNIVYDTSQNFYFRDDEGEVRRYYQDALILGYYENGKYIDTSKMKNADKPGRWKYYVIKPGQVYCYRAYEDTLISNFFYDQENQVMKEYEYKGLKKYLVALYKPVDDLEFNKYDINGNLISIFSRKKNNLKYWYEYSPSGDVITKHNTDFIPYQPVKYIP